jgi:hypothetical protein
MNWTCGVCGRSSSSNRRRCPTCGNVRWRPAAKKDLRELGGPIKRIAPRGLTLSAARDQAGTRDSSGIECGTCHMVIYRPDGVFDPEAFREAKGRHYSSSPACEARK